MHTYIPCSNCGAINKVQAFSEKIPICGKCKKSLKIHGAIADISGSELMKLIEKSPLPVVTDFWAPWCGPCRSFAPTFERASKEFLGKVVFAKLNTQEHPLANDAFKIQSIPTLIIFKAGLERTRISGALPFESFKRWVIEGLNSLS